MDGSQAGRRLRAAHAREGARLHDDRDVDAGARDRRHHGDLRARQLDAAPSARGRQQSVGARVGVVRLVERARRLHREPAHLPELPRHRAQAQDDDGPRRDPGAIGGGRGGRAQRAPGAGAARDRVVLRRARRRVRRRPSVHRRGGRAGASITCRGDQRQAVVVFVRAQSVRPWPDHSRQRRRPHRHRHHGAGVSGHGPRAGQRSLDAGQSLPARQPWTRRRRLARGRRILRVGGASGAGRQRPAGASGAADAHRMARRAIPGGEQEVHAAGQASRPRSDRRRPAPAEPAVDVARADDGAERASSC